MNGVQPKTNRPFSLLIKPTSADCNLRCTYCFYLEKSQLYPQESRHRMSDAVLERVIQSYMETDQEVYSFGWQGGEPTLMGLQFFEKVVEFQKKYGRRGVTVANGLQTNATLIGDSLASHLARYRFLVGCSLDGPGDIHNRYRVNHLGVNTHSRVIQGIQTLKQYGVASNILVLVSQANVHRAGEVYRYLVENGHLYHQYIPCVEFDDNGKPLPFSISGEEWGRFMCELFDAWYPDDVNTVSIRHFDSILSKLVDGTDTVCTMGRNCCQYFVVEYNGDIYPCDFFVEPALKLGNIMNTSWQELLESPAYLEFGAQKKDWNRACESCGSVELCAGDCLKHRMIAGNNSRNMSWLCEGWKLFLEHAENGFKQLSQGIIEKRKAAFGNRNVAPAKRATPGRNAHAHVVVA